MKIQSYKPLLKIYEINICWNGPLSPWYAFFKENSHVNTWCSDLWWQINLNWRSWKTKSAKDIFYGIFSSHLKCIHPLANKIPIFYYFVCDMVVSSAGFTFIILQMTTKFYYTHTIRFFRSFIVLSFVQKYPFLKNW